jgi:hypothetical protein
MLMHIFLGAVEAIGARQLVPSHFTYTLRNSFGLAVVGCANSAL